MNKLLTIIVPAYNMQAYLERCLNSLQCPQQQMLQVIVVNDGSTDGTLRIAGSYAEQWPDVFQVVNKHNGNYGSCINAALPLAEGKYIKVLDADDCFDTPSLCRLLNAMEHTQADMIITDYVKVRPDGEQRTRCHLTPGKPLNFVQLCEGQTIWNLWMHNVSYLTQHLKDMNYHQTEGISYTDQEWIFQPFTAVRTVLYLDLPLYRYTLGREGQTMNRDFMQKHFADNVVCTCHMLSIFPTFHNVPGPIMQLLQLKLLHRCRFIYRNYIVKFQLYNDPALQQLDDTLRESSPSLYAATSKLLLSKPLLPVRYIKLWRRNHHCAILLAAVKIYHFIH